MVVHPAALWSKELGPEKLAKPGIAPGLLRFAAGIESADDFIADLDEALNG